LRQAAIGAFLALQGNLSHAIPTEFHPHFRFNWRRLRSPETY